MSDLHYAKGWSGTWRSLLGVVLGLCALFALSSVQAGYTEPAGSPPLYNREAPVNLSEEFQDVTGGIQTDTIGVSYGISLNGVSRTVADGWPGTSGNAICYIETKRVDITTGGAVTFETDTGIGGIDHYPVCEDFLEPAARTAGWVATGSDNCLGTTGATCDVPSTCIYSRLVCSGSPGISVRPPVVGKMTYAGTPIQLPINSTSTNPL